MVDDEDDDHHRKFATCVMTGRSDCLGLHDFEWLP